MLLKSFWKDLKIIRGIPIGSERKRITVENNWFGYYSIELAILKERNIHRCVQCIHTHTYYTLWIYTLQLIFINKPKTRHNKSSQDKTRQEKRQHSTAEHNAPLIPCWFSFFLKSGFYLWTEYRSITMCDACVSTAITFYFCAHAHTHKHTQSKQASKQRVII